MLAVSNDVAVLPAAVLATSLDTSTRDSEQKLCCGLPTINNSSHSSFPQLLLRIFPAFSPYPVQIANH